MNLYNKSYLIIHTIVFLQKPESEFTKQGYLFLMEKSKSVNTSILKYLIFYVSIAEAFTATWSKYYCTYKKQHKQFSMLQYNQISGKTVKFI